MEGVLIINKPKGLTSHDIVVEVRRALGLIGRPQVLNGESTKKIKVGHTGTLDPVATGVLPICIGRATRLTSFLTQGEKEYIVTIKLGEETDTLDSQGEILYKSPVGKEIEAKIDKVLKTFEGGIDQIPPSYSAIKKDGIPLYRLARKGVLLKLKPRKVFIHAIHLLKASVPFIVFRAISSPGTYMRSLCRDIGRVLGCYGHLHALKRVRCGPFSLKDSLPLDDLKNMSLKDIEKWLIPMNRLLPELPAIKVDRFTEEMVRQGRLQGLKRYVDIDQCAFKLRGGDRIRFLSPEGNLISLAEINEIKDKEISFSFVRVF